MLKLETKTLSSSTGSYKQREKSVPYFFIGVEDLPLSENLMEVYPGQRPNAQKNEFSITGPVQLQEL